MGLVKTIYSTHIVDENDGIMVRVPVHLYPHTLQHSVPTSTSMLYDRKIKTISPTARISAKIQVDEGSGRFFMRQSNIPHTRILASQETQAQHPTCWNE